MAFWFVFLLWTATFAVSQIISALTTEVPANKKPSVLGDFTLPTADETRVLPTVTGTVRQSGPNVMWYGHLTSIAKTQKVSTSMFSSKKVITGYRYGMTILFAICKGPCVLKGIWVGEKKIWSGTQTVGGQVTSLWAGWGYIYFYPGDETQVGTNPWFAYKPTPTPIASYRGVSYVYFSGWVGEDSQNIAPWAFEIERIPNGLGLADATVSTADANPMNKLYEILTDIYGYGVGDIDVDGFKAAAATLKAEGNGFSLLEDTKGVASQLIQTIEKQIDGHVYLDPTTGQWKIQLIRDDYDVTSLDVFDEGNITGVLDFDKGLWTGTTNEVTVTYSNRAKDYVESPATAQDSANMQIQGEHVPLSLSLPGVKDSTLAARIAWRELRSLSYPFATARVSARRSMWNVHVGKPVLYDYKDANIPMRITKINMGGPACNAIELDLIQDVFSGVAPANIPSLSGWVTPDTDLAEFADTMIVEAPYAIIRRNADVMQPRIWTAAAGTGKAEVGFVIDVDDVASGSVYGLTHHALLETGVTAVDTTIDLIIDISTDGPPTAADFLSATADDVGQNLTNLFLLDDELIAATSVVDTETGIQMVGCYRGLCDTTPVAHAGNATAWLVSLGSGLNATILPSETELSVKLLPLSDDAVMDASSVTPTALILNYRALRPYPPSLLSLNGSIFPTTTSIDGGVAVTFNRRDWRWLDEVEQLTVDAATLNSAFPTIDSTQYRLRVYDGALLLFTVDYNMGTASIPVTRAKIVRYCAGIITPLVFSVTARHLADGVLRESLQDLSHTTVITSILTTDTFLGVISPTEVSTSWVAPVTGTYDFTLDKALASDVKARINGGGWSTIIAAGLTTGSLIGVTATDTIEVEHLDSTSLEEALLCIDAPGTDADAYVSLIFT
jgi:hypothetical protein